MSRNDCDNLPQCFQIPATEMPGFFAVRSGTERLTDAGLEARTDALCDRLAAAGIETGALAGILLDRSFSPITPSLAVLKAGGVPLDPSHPPIDRLRGELGWVKKLKSSISKNKDTEKWSMWPGLKIIPSAEACEYCSSILG